jgi:hypothetical protein
MPVSAVDQVVGVRVPGHVTTQDEGVGPVKTSTWALLFGVTLGR